MVKFLGVRSIKTPVAGQEQIRWPVKRNNASALFRVVDSRSPEEEAQAAAVCEADAAEFSVAKNECLEEIRKTSGNSSGSSSECNRRIYFERARIKCMLTELNKESRTVVLDPNEGMFNPTDVEAALSTVNATRRAAYSAACAQNTAAPQITAPRPRSRPVGL